MKALKAGLFDRQAWQKKKDIERKYESLRSVLMERDPIDFSLDL